MTRLLELATMEDLVRLTKIDWHSAKLLWHDDYCDGPKSGLLLYQNKRYWFQVFKDNEESNLSDYLRRFVILELTENQMKEEVHWHELFVEKVGTHTDYDENGKRVIGALKPEEIWHEFYDAYEKRQKPDLLNNIVIGWAET
jgi:hypothetical protein